MAEGSAHRLARSSLRLVADYFQIDSQVGSKDMSAAPARQRAACRAVDNHTRCRDEAGSSDAVRMVLARNACCCTHIQSLSPAV